MREVWLALRSLILSNTIKLLFRQEIPSLRFETIGSEYGGWTVPLDLIQPDWICYCAGAGEDITFDIGLSERFGCDIYSFDPTPRAIRHVQKTAPAGPRYRFYPIGLWSEDTTLKFYAPRDPQHVSHSALNLQQTSVYFEAPVRRLSTLMKNLRHDRIDLLKIDIEGAEHRVLQDMIHDGIATKVLLVEFDQPMPPLLVVTTIRRLTRAGYVPARVNRWNYTFIHRSTLH